MEQNGNPTFLESYNKLNAKFPVVPMGCLAVSFVGVFLSLISYAIPIIGNLRGSAIVVIGGVLGSLLGIIPYILAFGAMVVGVICHKKENSDFVIGIGFGLIAVFAFLGFISSFIGIIATIIKYFNFSYLLTNIITLIISLVVTACWGAIAMGFVLKKPKISELLKLGGAALLLVSGVVSLLWNILQTFILNSPLGIFSILGNVINVAVFFVGIVLFILTWRDLFLNIKELLKGIKNKKEDTVEV